MFFFSVESWVLYGDICSMKHFLIVPSQLLYFWNFMKEPRKLTDLLEFHVISLFIYVSKVLQSHVLYIQIKDYSRAQLCLK